MTDQTAARAAIAQLRRLYLHILSGGHITPADLSLVIARLEEIADAR